MWGSKSFSSASHASDTVFLDDLMQRLEARTSLVAHADAVINAAIAQEPLFAQAITTPQDIRFHAEGPVLHDHLRLALTSLFAFLEGELHLSDIEEFARLKGYDVELEELQESILEHAAFLQVYLLCHDLAKYITVTFDAPVGSLGAQEGFGLQWSDHFDESAARRAEYRAKYAELFSEFSKLYPDLSERDVQVQFYQRYKINVHYHRHGRAVHVPVYADLIDRFCQAFSLPGQDHDMMVDLISHHMEVINAFTKGANPKSIHRFAKIARKRGYDADQYIRLLQLCLLFDGVFGSKRFGAHGYWHDSTPFISSLQAAHNLAPWRRQERLQEREDKKKKERLQVFREVGLDGMALMDLLKMDPGPEFGLQLRRIHAAILGRGDLPSFSSGIQKELDQRIGQYYQLMFSGEHDV